MNLITGWNNDNIKYMPFEKGHPQFNSGRTWLKKGHSLNKGRKLSEEHKRKLSESHKGQIPWNINKKGIRLNPKTEFKKGHTPWNKGLIGMRSYMNIKGLEKGRGLFKGRHNLSISKEKHWNWQGGKTTQTISIRGSLEYKLWRQKVFERDDYTCQMCKKRGNGVLHADHIKPFAYFPELRFKLSNGQTLCEFCHKSTDTYGERAKKYAKN